MPQFANAHLVDTDPPGQILRGKPARRNRFVGAYDAKGTVLSLLLIFAADLQFESIWILEMQAVRR